MKRTLSSFIAAIVLSLALISGAQAATISLSNTVVPGNVDLNDITLGAGSAIVTGDLTSYHVLPVGLETDKQYLSVYGGGSATYSLTAPKTQLAFNWGTVDNYNTLRITTANSSTYDITGSQILALGSSMGLGLVAGKTNVYFMLSDLAGIVSATFLSTTNSFEVSDISAVPLPAALPLFGAALFGVAAVRRRKAA